MTGSKIRKTKGKRSRILARALFAELFAGLAGFAALSVSVSAPSALASESAFDPWVHVRADQRDARVPLGEGPYYAVALYPTMLNTQGGPKKNVYG